MRRLSCLVFAVLALVLAPHVQAAVSCGSNGQCSAARDCPYWSTASTAAAAGVCASNEVCCQPPTCSSNGEAGVCKTTSTCNSGRYAVGLCPGDKTVTCCLPQATTSTTCQANGAFGNCVKPSSCTSGTQVSGGCSADLTCCIPNNGGQPSCVAQGQVGVCQSGSCASGNSISGLCDDSKLSCCLPNPPTVIPAQTCAAQGLTGTCLAPSASCSTRNVVTGFCSNGYNCCLSQPVPTSGLTCNVQGQPGECMKTSQCSAGGKVAVAGLCPGDADVQCCVSSTQNFGSCATSDGFVGTCTDKPCANGGRDYGSSLCPGAGTRCCVTETTPRTPPAQDWGKCVAKGRVGSCKAVSTCAATGGPVAGLCPGPNDVQCCPDGANLPSPVWASAPPAAGTFFGACNVNANTPGSCRNTSVAGSCTAATSTGQCPSDNSVLCCADGGVARQSTDLPGGKGIEVSSLGGALTSTVATCVKNTAAPNGPISFVMARGWAATCMLDSTVVSSLASAAAAGIPADVVLVPAFWCGLSAKAQVSALLGALVSAGSTFGRVWVRVTENAAAPASRDGQSQWGQNKAANQAWIQAAVDALSSQLGSARVGIHSSVTGWDAVVGKTVVLANTYPVWYGLSGTTLNFADFGSFGGWIAPSLKSIPTPDTPLGQPLCGITVQPLWNALPSATTAAAGSAPPAEVAGPACSAFGASGVCRSPASCTGTSAAGVCANAGQTCCLTGTPVRPAADTSNNVTTVSFGYCSAGGSTSGPFGVCQPRSQCDPTDTIVADSSCVGDGSVAASSVACCVAAAGNAPYFEMPPNDDPTQRPLDNDPELSRAARPVSRVTAVRPASVSRATAANTAGSGVASRVCINKAGLTLLESFEGFEANFYNDAVGIKTIGFGTACHSYPCDTIKAPLTRAQAEVILLADMNARFAPCVRNFIKVPLNSNQFSALVSFVYNVGCGGLKGSVGTQLNQGLYGTVADNMAKWNKAGGKVLTGLTRRRTAEGALFENSNIAPCLDNAGSSGATSSGAEQSEGQSWGSCSSGGKTGDCIDASDCEGQTVSGLCKGPATVKCCLDSAPNPPAPSAQQCGNGGSCIAVSSCNTNTNAIRRGLCPGDSSIACCQPKSAAAADGWWAGATRDEMSAGSSFVAGYPKRIVLHTTEGGSYEGARNTYSGTHPHFTVTFQRGMFQAYQHVSILTSAKALKNGAGGVETNRGGAIQIELVGSATSASKFDQRYLDGIAKLLRWIESVHNIPRKAATFLAYPASAGNSKVRMSDAAWKAFSGTCGHQHVPENAHGDPGTINIDYLMRGDGAIFPPSDPAASLSTQPGVNGNPGDAGKCTSAGRTGVCQAKSECGGTIVAGLCAGDSSIACCMEAGAYGTCSAPAANGFPAADGQCQESSTCSGRKVSGLCPGPASVSCCVPDYGTCSSAGQTGVCKPTADCKDTVVGGLCAGPSTVSCCLPTKAADYGSCSVSYPSGPAVKGQCIPRANCASPALAVGGLCPGPADIACCHNPAPLRTLASCGNNGFCQDTATCSGTVRKGLCPGASNIACCENGDRPAARTGVPVSRPRSLFAASVTTSAGVVVDGTLPSNWNNVQLTVCSAGGLQGFCLDSNVGGAVCNGVTTFPSTCSGNALCCTPQPCAVSNSTTGVCIPPAECSAQAGSVTPGLCGASGTDGSTSCCTGVGQALCDTSGLMDCLVTGGDPTVCAISFGCPPLPDYSAFLGVQSAPSEGKMAHSVDDPNAAPESPPAQQDLSAAFASASVGLASILAVVLALLAANQA